PKALGGGAEARGLERSRVRRAVDGLAVDAGDGEGPDGLRSNGGDEGGRRERNGIAAVVEDQDGPPPALDVNHTHAVDQAYAWPRAGRLRKCTGCGRRSGRRPAGGRSCWRWRTGRRRGLRQSSRVGTGRRPPSAPAPCTRRRTRPGSPPTPLRPA